MFTTLGSEAGFFSVEQGLLYLEVGMDSSLQNRVYYTWRWGWILLCRTGFTILGVGDGFFSVEQGLLYLKLGLDSSQQNREKHQLFGDKPFSRLITPDLK